MLATWRSYEQSKKRSPIFLKPEFQTATLVNVNGRSILCCHRYGRLVIGSAGTTLGAHPAELGTLVEEGRNRQVVIEGGVGTTSRLSVVPVADGGLSSAPVSLSQSARHSGCR